MIENVNLEIELSNITYEKRTINAEFNEEVDQENLLTEVRFRREESLNFSNAASILPKDLLPGQYVAQVRYYMNPGIIGPWLKKNEIKFDFASLSEIYGKIFLHGGLNAEFLSFMQPF